METKRKKHIRFYWLGFCRYSGFKNATATSMNLTVCKATPSLKWVSNFISDSITRVTNRLSKNSHPMPGSFLVKKIKKIKLTKTVFLS